MDKVVELWRMQDSKGTRLLEASLIAGGDLRLSGLDWGDGVEEIFGYREYEYVLTVKSADLPQLQKAIGRQADILTSLQKLFSSQQAAGPKTFLDEHNIPYDFWSRLGD